MHQCCVNTHKYIRKHRNKPTNAQKLMLEIAFRIIILLCSSSKQDVKQMATNSKCLFISLEGLSEQFLIYTDI